MIRKIFVPIRGDGKGENILRHALAIARRFDAHIEAVHCHPRPDDLLPFGVPIPAFVRDQVREQARHLAEAEEAKLRNEFDTLAARFGLPVVDRPTAGVASIAWIEEEGKQIDVVKRRGRLCDLLVVAKPDRSRNLGANTLKTALFNAGRPVMMCPPTDAAPTALGEHIALAWNGSLEATRTVAMCPGLLSAAKKITILAIDEKPGAVNGAAALADYLALRGLELDVKHAESAGDIGGTLLTEAKASGADLVLMGAYGDSHERETIFGGNTQTVVDTADQPVIFVH